MLQIFVFLLFFSAVNDVAADSPDAFLWVPALGEADPTLILPAILAVLIFVHLQLTAVKRGRLYLAWRLLAAGLLLAITFHGWSMSNSAAPML